MKAFSIHRADAQERKALEALLVRASLKGAKHHWRSET
jgi:hypothetical protein